VRIQVGNNVLKVYSATFIARDLERPSANDHRCEPTGRRCSWIVLLLAHCQLDTTTRPTL
jgi:hypothetical protein